MLQDLSEATLPVWTDSAAPHNIVLNGRVLLVEDGRDNQRLLRMQLRDAGAVVSTATDGQIAVDMATTQPFDLILMDMQMPFMDGYAATAELRRRGLKMPIIALTAHAMADDRAKCLASGCDDYLSKPCIEETLLKIVDKYLGQGHSRVPADGAGENVAGSCPPPRGANGPGGIKSSLADNPRMRTILPEFVAGLPGEVRKMIDFLERNDLAALCTVVHQLGGASGGYGFAVLTEPAVRVEESIGAGKALDAVTAEIKSLIEVIRRIEGYDESNAPIAAEGPPTYAPEKDPSRVLASADSQSSG